MSIILRLMINVWTSILQSLELSYILHVLSNSTILNFVSRLLCEHDRRIRDFFRVEFGSSIVSVGITAKVTIRHFFFSNRERVLALLLKYL